MYEQLLTADVVIADLSTSNANAFYELGVRHALRPFTTITIAENKLKYPFDVNHIAIRSYEHMGNDIGFGEVVRMRKELKRVIKSVLDKPAPDSPIYTYIKGLTPPEVRKAAELMAGPAKTKEASPPAGASDAVQLEKLSAAKAEGNWTAAREQCSRIREDFKAAGRPEDPYIVQQLALATYKSKQPDAVRALRQARKILLTLSPSTSHDPETHGLLGAVAKRLFEETKEKGSLDEAIACYERGFYLKNDYYNGINLAYLLNLRASASSRADATADCVLAGRIRSKVVAICKAIDAKKLSADDQYWVAATLEEAYFGLGDRQNHEKSRAKAIKLAKQPWMRDTTEEQIGKLGKLLKAADKVRH